VAPGARHDDRHPAALEVERDLVGLDVVAGVGGPAGEDRASSGLAMPV
jgi:hypothetical protein